MKTLADTVKLLPGAVSRTGPDVVNALLVPLKVEQLPLPPPAPHQTMFEPKAGFAPSASSAIDSESSSFSAHQLTAFGSEGVTGVPCVAGAALAGVVVAGCDPGVTTAGAVVSTPADEAEGEGRGGLTVLPDWVCTLVGRALTEGTRRALAELPTRGATFPASGPGTEARGEADDAAPAMVIGILPPDSDSLAVADRATDTTATMMTPPIAHADFFPIRGRAPGPGSVTLALPPTSSLVVVSEFAASPDGTVLCAASDWDSVINPLPCIKSAGQLGEITTEPFGKINRETLQAAGEMHSGGLDIARLCALANL
jgi:hypothetical protein